MGEDVRAFHAENWQEIAQYHFRMADEVLARNNSDKEKELHIAYIAKTVLIKKFLTYFNYAIINI